MFILEFFKGWNKFANRLQQNDLAGWAGVFACKILSGWARVFAGVYFQNY